MLKSLIYFLCNFASKRIDITFIHLNFKKVYKINVFEYFNGSFNEVHEKKSKRTLLRFESRTLKGAHIDLERA